MKLRFQLPAILVAGFFLSVGGGEPPREVFNIPTVLRWGNFLWPPFPAKPPVFTQPDLIGRNPRFVDHTRSVKTNLSGNYTFKSRQGARQVVWVANSLLRTNTTFKVSGFSWGIYPQENRPSQSLTIMGVPGKVFITGDQNNGSYTLTIKR